MVTNHAGTASFFQNSVTCEKTGAPQTGRVSLTLLCSALLCSALLFKHVRKSAHCQALFHSRFSFALAVPTQSSPEKHRSNGPAACSRLARTFAGWLLSLCVPALQRVCRWMFTPRIYQFLRFFARAGPHILRRILCRIFGNGAKKRSTLRFRMPLFLYVPESAVR